MLAAKHTSVFNNTKSENVEVFLDMFIWISNISKDVPLSHVT